MLQAQTQLFDIAPGARYMNGAAYSPTLKASNQAGLDAINLKAQNPFTLEPYHHFDIPDQLRAEFAKLINSDSHNRVALIPAVSYGMATAAKNLHRLPGISEKKEIVIVHDDFPNNYFTFKKAAEQLGLTLRIVGPTEGSTNTGADWHEKIMEAVGPQTAILVATHVHWIKGIRFDLEALGTHCRGKRRTLRHRRQSGMRNRTARCTKGTARRLLLRRLQMAAGSVWLLLWLLRPLLRQR